MKCIDYFNPPICESVILVALHSTGESLMGLGADRLRPLPVQLTFNWSLAGESGEAGSTHTHTHCDPPQAASSECHYRLLLIKDFSFLFNTVTGSGKVTAAICCFVRSLILNVFIKN